MHTESLDHWRHDHAFGQDRRRQGEGRTIVVVVITAITMVVEITAGIAYGSMALLADGLHMASHACALGITVLAYVYSRRHAHDRRYSFGTGKVNALGGFTGAVLLAAFAGVMAWESGARLLEPVPILFNQAIAVAFLGLVVNAASLFVLGGHHGHGESGHDGPPSPGHSHSHSHGHDHSHGHGHSHGRGDHNLRAAYLHVLADALTSLFAIFALLSGKFLGWVWMDPILGIVGAALVARWSWGLLRDTSHVLLDRQAPATIRDAVRHALETHDDARVSDLHVWSIGPGILAAEITVVADQPLEPDAYKARLPADLGLVHVTVETHSCAHWTETE